MKRMNRLNLQQIIPKFKLLLLPRMLLLLLLHATILLPLLSWTTACRCLVVAENIPLRDTDTSYDYDGDRQTFESTSSSFSSSPLDDAFEEKVAWALEHFKVPGFAVSVVRGDETFAKVGAYCTYPKS